MNILTNNSYNSRAKEQEKLDSGQYEESGSTRCLRMQSNFDMRASEATKIPCFSEN